MTAQLESNKNVTPKFDSVNRSTIQNCLKNYREIQLCSTLILLSFHLLLGSVEFGFCQKPFPLCLRSEEERLPERQKEKEK